MEEDLAEHSVRELAVEPVGAWVGFLPEVMAPCCNLDVHPFCHQKCLRGIQDDRVDFA